MSDVNVAPNREGTILSDGIDKYDFLSFCVDFMASVLELNCHISTNSCIVSRDAFLLKCFQSRNVIRVKHISHASEIVLRMR
jgi:hypothetical protein